MKTVKIILVIGMIMILGSSLAAASWASMFPTPTALGPGELQKPGEATETLTPVLTYVPSGAINYLYLYDADKQPRVLADNFSNQRTPVIQVRTDGTSLQIPAGVLEAGKTYYWYVVSVHAPGSKSEAMTMSQTLYFTTPGLKQ